MTPRAGILAAALAAAQACAPAPDPRAGAPTIAVASDDASLASEDGVMTWRGAPLDGVVEERDGERLVRRTTYRAGLRDGVEERFYADGTLESTRIYAGGLKEGRHRGYWPDGARRFDLRFSEGRYAGTQRRWYASGQPYQLGHYERGEEIGRQQTWTVDGRLFANYVVRDGRRFGLIGAKPCFTVGGDES